MQSVRDMAAEHDIALLQMGDLSAVCVFDELEPDSIDFVLFTEILEYITFNPVGMWQAIHRVLKPGGKVIITTPYDYFWQSRAWDFGRFARRMGGGIPVHEIITQITCATTGRTTVAAKSCATLTFCQTVFTLITCTMSVSMMPIASVSAVSDLSVAASWNSASAFFVTANMPKWRSTPLETERHGV